MGELLFCPVLTLRRWSSFTQSNWCDNGFLFIVFLRSQLEQTPSIADSSEALCNFTITEHACSSVRLFYISRESQRKIWLLLHHHPETNLHKLWESLLYFLSNSFQGYTSHTQQLGDTDELLTGKPKDIPGRGLETFLPKSFHCTRPGSCDVRHHGKSNPTISQNWCFPVWILCQTKMIFPILGPQQQQPILVTCSWGSWRGEDCQLQPGTTAEWGLCQTLVPDKDSSVFGLSVPQLPILP